MVLTGSFIPWPNPSSSGSGSSNTVKHEDGSVTTTVTGKKTGNVTETTKSPSGVTSTTVTDSEGNVTEIFATLPASAVESGETASLPIGAVDSTAGTTLSVDVPTGGARVEIPVENPTAGTVVVAVHADGAQTVLADSKLSKNGVTVTLKEGCTLKIVENAKDFDDVTEGSYFAEAVENGIVNGYGNGSFGANDPITREQAAVMLYRFAQARGLDTTQSGKGAEEFADFASISDYARTAMEWAVNTGILQGYDNTLMPQAQCDRGQITTMLYRLLGQ